MARTMYDGVDASRLPADAQLVGGYVDGLYAWSAADWARFPNSVKVRIACFRDTDDGEVLDVERGNATPAESVDWALMRRDAGVDPTVYCNQMDPDTGWPAVRAAFQARGVAEPHYWVAHYDGTETIPPGAIAKQHTNDERAGWDLSVVADHWPGIDPSPAAASSSASTVRSNDMHIDLKPNTPVVFTNPAAALGGTSRLLLACDFGDAVVRVATFSFKSESWTVDNATITSKGAAYNLAMPPDINKVSVSVTAGSCPVGLDVLA